MMSRSEYRSTFGWAGRTGIRGWIVAAIVVLAGMAVSEAAVACAVCYGAEDSSMTAGMNNAILLLLGVGALVQGGFVALFLSLRKRARRERSQGRKLQAMHGGTL